MEIKKIYIYFIIYSLAFNSTFAASNCRDKDKKTHIRASLTERGLEKVVSIGLEKAKKPIVKSLESLKIPDFRKYADYKGCKKDKVDKMTIAESWKKCPGLPLLLINEEGTPFSDLAKPLPSHYQFKNIDISNLEIGEIDIKCKKMECDISIPIDKLAVTTDINVDSSYTGKSVFGVNKATLTIDKNKKNESPELKFKAKLNTSGELEDLIQMPSGFLSAELPLNSLKIGLGGKNNDESLSEEMDKVFDENLKNDLSILAEKAKKKFSKKEMDSKKFKDWKDKELGKISDKYVDLVSKRHKKKTQKHFLNKKSYELYALAEVMANQEGGIAQQVARNIAPKVATAVEDKLRKVLSPFTKKLPFIHDEYSVANTSLKIQDHINHSKYKKAPAKFLKQLNKCLKKFKSRHCDFEDFEKVLISMRSSSNEKDADILFEMKYIAKKGLDVLSGVKTKGFFVNRARKKAKKGLNNIYRNLFPKTVNAISDNLYKRNLEQQVAIAVKSVEETPGLLNMYLTTCIGCGQFELPEIEEIPMKEDLPKSEYDLAVGIDLRTINATLENLQKKGMFDFCVSDNKFTSCKESDFFDEQQRIEFKKAPKLVWSDKKQAYVLKISDLLREQDILGLPTSWIGNRDYNDLDIAMKPGISEDGKSVFLKPVGDINLDYGIVRDGQSLLVPAILTLVAPYAGVAFEVARAGAHELVSDYATESLRDNMNKGMDVTEDLPLDRIVKIQSDKNEIRVYSTLE